MSTHETPAQLMPTPPNPVAVLNYVMAALNQLSPDEVARLDAAISPDVAYLLVKAFGPGMGVLLWPLIADDPGVRPPS